MKVFKKKGSKKGFSLIELMIVVAIIGILAAIALPNFTRFQRKARQSEAKGLLGSYHTALKATAAEIGCFAGNFVAIGFQPEGELYYRINTANNVGAGSCVLPTATAAINEAACIVTSATCVAVAGYAKTWTERATVSAPTAAAAMTNNTYTTTSSGNLGNTTTNDEWRINDGKLLVNVTSGL